jgi:hypothetical protein
MTRAIQLADVCHAVSYPNSSDPYIRYTYDAVGNRLTGGPPGGTTTYDYNAGNLLSSKSGAHSAATNM